MPFIEATREVVVRDVEQVPSQSYLHLLSPCSHKEADIHMMLHVVHAAQHHQRILVHTVDTDSCGVGCDGASDITS